MHAGEVMVGIFRIAGMVLYLLPDTLWQIRQLVAGTATPGRAAAASGGLFSRLTNHLQFHHSASRENFFEIYSAKAVPKGKFGSILLF
jgi:hypothetical protein